MKIHVRLFVLAITVGFSSFGYAVSKTKEVAVAKVETKEKPVEFCHLMKNKEMEMEVISSNIENVNTTHTPEGGPYKAKKLICNDNMCAILSYKNVIAKLMPGHPDADEKGYVKFPDIDLQAEMQSMIDARGVYEQAARNCKTKRVMQ